MQALKAFIMWGTAAGLAMGAWAVLKFASGWKVPPTSCPDLINAALLAQALLVLWHILLVLVDGMHWWDSVCVLHALVIPIFWTVVSGVLKICENFLLLTSHIGRTQSIVGLAGLLLLSPALA